MIGIIGAMESETAAIIREMDKAESKEISGVRFVRGIWSGKEIVIATCGVGKVFAALCTEAMILHYQPDCIINTGVAGALDPRLELLNVVIATRVVQHDMDTSPLGDPVGLLSGINKVELPADPALIRAFQKAADAIGTTAVQGVIASGDQFIAEQQKKNLIRTRFGAACCEMEAPPSARSATSIRFPSLSCVPSPMGPAKKRRWIFRFSQRRLLVRASIFLNLP